MNIPQYTDVRDKANRQSQKKMFSGFPNYRLEFRLIHLTTKSLNFILNLFLRITSYRTTPPLSLHQELDVEQKKIEV